MKMFTEFALAKAHADKVAKALTNGEVRVLELRDRDMFAYLRAVELLTPTGVPLEMAAADYAEAWKALGGKASLVEAAKEFARRHLHELPDKRLPASVAEMIEIFFQYVPTKLAEARAAEDSGDLGALQHAVHPLKSSAGNLGAAVMKELAARIEQLAMDHDGAPISGLMRELEAAYTQACAALESHRKTLGV